MKNNRVLIILLIIVIIAIGIFVYYLHQMNSFEREITNFEECATAGYPVQESYPRRCTAHGETFVEDIPNADNVENYFVEALREKAIARVGMPIEGFTPELYITAFPALQDVDFNNVEAINGLWKFEDNELVFIHDSGGYITSADGTLTDEGAKTLLKNLEARLDREIKSPPDVDILIDSLLSEAEQHVCSPESKNTDFCTTIYKPVCGWLDPKKIQCIRYPCAQTFSNSCFACMNDEVVSWTEGECPRG